MSEIKWIKITTDIFDDEKILLIESLPDADAIIVIWFKLLCLAGKQNNSGVFLMNDRIPYTDKMLATIFRRKEATVQLALHTFEQFGMVELVDGVITIPNWEKHQNIDGMEKIREQNRQRVRDYRGRQKKLLEGNVTGNVTSNVTVTDCNAPEEDKDKEKEEEKEKEKERINYQAIVDLYNETCVSFPSVRSLSEARRKAIRARMKTYGMEDFKRLFEAAEASSFLRGGNERNWSANFDWLIKDSNMAKVLDGNYDNKGSSPWRPKESNRTAQSLEQSYEMIKSWAEE